MLTDDELAAIHMAYHSMWVDYQKVMRVRALTKETKEFKLTIYKKRLRTFQRIITEHLGVDCTFKEL